MKVVCIDNKTSYIGQIVNLTLGKYYTILKEILTKSDIGDPRFLVKDDKNEETIYYQSRFVNINIFREEKLKRLLK